MDPIMGDSIYAAVALVAVIYLALVYVASRFPDIEMDDPEGELEGSASDAHLFGRGLFRATDLYPCLEPDGADRKP